MFALQQLLDEGAVVCPRCGSPVAPAEGGWRCSDATCRYADEPFPVVAGTPALVDFEHSVVSLEKLRASEGASQIERAAEPGLVRRLLHPANKQAPVIAARMVDLLCADDNGSSGRRPRVLVIGGGTVGDGLGDLYADERVDLIGFDVYASANTQFVGDAHDIPLADGSVDAVVIQAVLEHVLQPHVVVEEIRRVLRPGGLVYADTPFLQQVHEGAYDFTRFTDSGHRYLFREFERIDSGQVAGAGTALRWSIGYFVRALTRSVALGRVASLAFFWLSYLDPVLDAAHSLDAASSVFFLGRKAPDPITPRDAITYYQGGM